MTIIRCIGSLTVAATALTATAADLRAEDSKNWELMLGAGAFYAPEYLGSDEYKTEAVPFIEFMWRDTVSFGPGGLGLHYETEGGLGFEASLGYGGGRKESDSAYLTGLGDIDDGAVLSFGMEYDAGPIAPYLEVSKFFQGTEGITAELGVRAMMPLAALTGGGMPDMGDDKEPRGTVLFGGLSAAWGNDDFNQGHFGVTAAQNVSSGLAQYSAGAGVHSASLELGFRTPLSENWSLNGVASYTRILGDAADSPVVKDEDQFGVGMFIGYSF